jgi:1A family penicillin-binding protein
MSPASPRAGLMRARIGLGPGVHRGRGADRFDRTVSLLRTLCSLVLAIALGAVGLAATVAAVGPHVADVWNGNAAVSDTVNLDELALNSYVYAADKSFLGVLHGPQNRESVPLADVSPVLVKAILAVEDSEFYVHSGINVSAIARALVRNVASGGIEQGGSTITQQLIKNSVLSSEQDLNRKLPEAALALRLEKQMTKDQILERYLNTVYFGSGAYGVESAAQVYFSKSAKDITWPEAAMLAGIIKNPTTYDPTLHPDQAETRRRVVLERLRQLGEITRTEYFDYDGTPLPVVRQVQATSLDALEDDYFLEEVKQRLLDDVRLGPTREDRINKLFAGGLRIYTTLDPKAQDSAERAVRDNVPENDRGFTAALASVEPGTGAVRALVGGPGFATFKFDVATQKGRPTGSSFKAFVLAAAMEAGYTPDDTIDGTGPCTFDNKGGTPDPYTSENFSGTGGFEGTIRSETLASSNCAYLRLAQVVGLGNVISTAQALGVTSQLDRIISLPLGVEDVTPLDMATAYATLANDGVRVSPKFVERVEDTTGKVLFTNEPQPSRAVSQQTARLVSSVLEENVRSGTGTRARLPGQPAAGKTGTASNFYDAWFVGYTPYLSTAVWMGNPAGSVAMRNVGGVSSVTGGTFPARIWNQLNTDYHEGLPIKEFLAPDPTGRSGRYLETAADKSRRETANRNSPCGDTGSEVDANGDGVPDSCSAGGDPVSGVCPALLAPVDDNGDGVPDRCVPKPSPTTTTTTAAPTTTVKPAGAAAGVAPTATTVPTTATPAAAVRSRSDVGATAVPTVTTTPVTLQSQLATNPIASRPP